MDAFPDNPFTPGFGLEPAYRGRRPETEGELLRILQRLRSRKRGAHAAVLYGPRGNGKTVLLQWLEDQARGMDGGKPIAQVRFSSRDLISLERMGGAIRRAAARWESLARHLSFKVRTEIPFLFSAELGTDSRDPLVALEDWFARSADPLLLTIDEAHEADPEALGDFLDSVQIAGAARPVAPVLAGTPGLMTTLIKSRASFWSRCEKLPIGLLSDQASRAVLAEPFRKAGLDAQDTAVGELAEAADNYPFFLQLHGEAAWDVVAASGERRLHSGHVGPALEKVDTPRRRFYGERYAEFDRRALLLLARDVALAFRTAPGRRLDLGELDAVLLRHDGDRVAMSDFLEARGYIWKDTDGTSWTPGIPSLMDFMVELTESGSASPAPSR